MTSRQPAVAGTFYPANHHALKGCIDDYLRASESRRLSPKVLVAPHAGYQYSGPIAASAYRTLADSAEQIERVVLLGPAHRIAFEGLALSFADQFITPLGSIPIDTSVVDELARFAQVQVLDSAHLYEHSLEVQCPFLQVSLSSFKLVPIVVGDAAPLAVAEVLEALWGGPETLIVISTDLSHYHNYDEACVRDRITCVAIEQLESTLTGGQACGCHPLNGLMALARKKGMEVVTLDLRNSGDTAGDRQRVVGYGAWILR